MVLERFNSMPLEERYLLVREYGELLYSYNCGSHVHVYFTLGSLYVGVVIELQGLDPITVKALGNDDPELEGLLRGIWLEEIDEYCQPGHDQPF